MVCPHAGECAHHLSAPKCDFCNFFILRRPRESIKWTGLKIIVFFRCDHIFRPQNTIDAKFSNWKLLETYWKLLGISGNRPLGDVRSLNLNKFNHIFACTRKCAQVLPTRLQMLVARAGMSQTTKEDRGKERKGKGSLMIKHPEKTYTRRGWRGISVLSVGQCQCQCIKLKFSGHGRSTTAIGAVSITDFAYGFACGRAAQPVKY